MSAFSTAKTFEFIELYKNEPCIWNPKNKHHKDKRKIDDAWTRISNAMGIPVDELKRKKESLYTTFRLNYKKVVRSQMSGEEEPLIPTWTFYDAMSFMCDVYDPKTFYTEDHIEPNTNSPSDVDSSIRLQEQSKRFISDIINKASNPIRKYSLGLPEYRKYLDSSNKLSKRNNDGKKIAATSLAHSDEFQIYGLYVANQLKSLSEEQSLLAREKIQSILTQCRLRDLRNKKRKRSTQHATDLPGAELENVEIVLCEERDKTNKKYKSKTSSSNLISLESPIHSDTDILEDNFIMHVENIKGEGKDAQDSDSDD
ncbi:uncharacterized protein LOC125225114 [Leguminivora glycinivorella]|uniref:uncharacterized protein LOC125225114 n=1 Tax=Leguminivora glycinivorella TaxID=1035111 RepID=UPI00200F6160|nr:uncharacterized protein LOC125225114 [Leguminivora glycinivorella]